MSKLSPQTRAAVIETTKELARIALFGAISAVLSYLTTKVGNLPPDSAYTLIGTLLLRAADKYVHSHADIAANGIAPF